MQAQKNELQAHWLADRATEKALGKRNPHCRECGGLLVAIHKLSSGHRLWACPECQRNIVYPSSLTIAAVKQQFESEDEEI